MGLLFGIKEKDYHATEPCAGQFFREKGQVPNTAWNKIFLPKNGISYENPIFPQNIQNTFREVIIDENTYKQSASQLLLSL